MSATPAPVLKLIDEFGRLPGIGPKSASRLTFYLLRSTPEQAVALAEALQELHEKVIFCSRCFNITETDPCPICSDEGRDQKIICVVEAPLDVLAIERTGDFYGTFHVLHGAIAPVEGIGPEDLRIAELIERVGKEKSTEVIIATNPNMEGEATAMYILRQLESAPVNVTRLARGLPVGGDLEYADEVTLVEPYPVEARCKAAFNKNIFLICVMQKKGYNPASLSNEWSSHSEADLSKDLTVIQTPGFSK